MISKPSKFKLLLNLLICGLFLSSAGIISLSSPVEAQSSKEVRVAVDQVRATLINTTNELRAAEKSNTANLKSGLLKSLNQLLSALTQIATVLDTAQDKQERKVDNNQLYCTAFFDISSRFIDGCYLANNPNSTFVKTFDTIQVEGWHLTAVTPTNGNRMLVVYSKYVE